MVELKRVSGKAVIRALERLGFAQTRQRGSHVVMKKIADPGVGCVVPLHRDVAVGTLRGILKQAKVSHEDFLDNL